MRVVTAGATIDLGTTETAPTIGLTDYSRRVTDDFGVTTVVERGFSRTLSARLLLPFEGVDALQQQLAALRATSAQWIADDRFAWLSVEGFYKDFSLDLAMPPVSYCTLTVEGLAETEVVTDPGGDPAPAGATSTLQLLQPTSVTDAVLVASSLDESDAALWDAGTRYAAGARVILAATHRVYQSLTAQNIGQEPDTTPAAWLDLGPTNRWAMFDEALGTASAAPGSISVTLDAGTARSIALLDVVAATVRVQAGGYDRMQVAGAGAITFLDLPAGAGQVVVTITGPGQVSVGTLLVGKVVALGITEASPTAGIADYSRKEVDDFGAVTIVQRAWAKRMTAKALIRTDAIDVVASRIAGVRARPSLWLGQVGLDSLTVYGFFKDFSIEVGETLSKLSLSIEGLSTAGKAEPLGSLINWEDVADPTSTKPANNADVTADNTAKDTNAVGGVPAPGVLASIAGNTFHQIMAAADGELARLRTRALSFLGPSGEDSYTLIRRETTERKDADGVFAETFDILGAVTPDGHAFVINTSTVRITPTESMAQRFAAIAATFGAQSASIEHIDEVLVGPSGSTARALVTVDVNGRIIGTALTNDGSAGGFVVSADNFRLEDPDTGQPYLYADDTGKVVAHNVEVDTLKVDTVDFRSMQLGAAQKAAWTTLPADFQIPRGKTRAVFSMPFVKEDTDSVLEIQAFMNAKSPDDLQFDVTIQIDGMVMQAVPGVNIILDTQQSQGQMPVTPFVFASGIAAGAHTISVKVYNREDDDVSLTIQIGSTLKVVELRKGSIGSSTGSGGAIPVPTDADSGGTGSGNTSGGGGGGYIGRGDSSNQLN